MSGSESTVSTASNRDLSKFLVAVFAAWKSAGIRFVVLRNHEQLPHHISNDLDVLVAPSQRLLAELSLKEAAQAAGYVLHNRAEFTPVCLFLFHEDTLEQVQVDLFDSLGYRALDMLPVGGALERRLERECFAVPHPVDEAVMNLVTRLLYSGYIKEKYKPSIQAVFSTHSGEAHALLANAFGPGLGAFLMDAVQAQDWGAIEKRRRSLIRSLCSRRLRDHPLKTMSNFVHDAWRLLRRLLRPPGLSVVLVGPDGCGKSAVADGVVDLLRHTFAVDKGLRIHWKPAVFTRRRREDRPPTTDPHKQPPRGMVVSSLFLLLHWTEFLLGALLQVLPVRFRNGLVLIDRHYYDFLVDPYRYRLNVPRWAVKVGAMLLPQPDLVFLLDAPAEVLQSRKREVPLEETARQRTAYFDLVQAMPNGRVIDAAQPLHDVTRKVTRIILEHLAARTQRRLGRHDE